MKPLEEIELPMPDCRKILESKWLDSKTCFVAKENINCCYEIINIYRQINELNDAIFRNKESINFLSDICYFFASACGL